MTVNELMLQIVKLTAAEQYDLAFKAAENIGYAITPAKCEYCGNGPCENCMNTGYANPISAELVLAAEELSRLQGDVYWVLAKGRLRPTEPLWAVRITDHEGETIVEVEGDHPADTVRLAASRLSNSTG